MPQPVAPALPPAAAPAHGVAPARAAELREVATAFEASFLAEMLTHAGLAGGAPGFDGGPGEAAFGGMLVAEQARLMAEAGGIGIAESVFEALLKREGAP